MSQFAKWISIVSLSFFSAQAVHATSILKSVQVQGTGQVELQFDTKIAKNQFKTEFFRDIVQISIKDSSVYPAKIASLPEGDLTKVFAYQYTPNLIRARFSVKGNAEEFQDRVAIEVNGNSLIFKLKTTTGSKPSAPAASLAIPSAATTLASKPLAKPMTEGEKTLLDQVMKESVPAPDKKAEMKKDTLTTSQSSALGKPLTGPTGSRFGQFSRLLAWSALLIGFLGACFLYFRRGKGNRAVGKGGMLSKLAAKLGKAPIVNAPKIDVLANHFLGPKKSIAVVRVKDKTLVLGITDDSINLITQMMDAEPLSEDFDDEAQKFLADDLARSKPQTGAQSKAYPSSASAASKSSEAALDEAFASMLDVESTAADHFGVRNRIKKKVEALKQI